MSSTEFKAGLSYEVKFCLKSWKGDEAQHEFTCAILTREKIQTRERVQGLSRFYRQFEASLGCLRAHLVSPSNVYNSEILSVKCLDYNKHSCIHF